MPLTHSQFIYAKTVCWEIVPALYGGQVTFPTSLFQNISASLPGGEGHMCETRHCSCASIRWQLCNSWFLAILGAVAFLPSLHCHPFFLSLISCCLSFLIFLVLFPPKMFLGTHQEMPLSDRWGHVFAVLYCLCPSQQSAVGASDGALRALAAMSDRDLRMPRPCNEDGKEIRNIHFIIHLQEHHIPKIRNITFPKKLKLFQSSGQKPFVSYFACHRIFTWLCLKTGIARYSCKWT